MLLSATFAGALNNNIVNVPLHEMLTDLHEPLSRGVLVIVAFTVTFSVLLPVAGWVGDRCGRRRVFHVGTALFGLSVIGSALAPNLPVLVADRVVQGVATAALLPPAMAMIAEVLGPGRRARALALWAVSNGLGQALGAPLGGIIADAFGWRAVFWVVLPPVVYSVALTARVLRPEPPVPVPLEWRGALLLTGGSALLLVSTTVVPDQGFGSPLVIALASGALLTFGGFVRSIRRTRAPFIAPRVFADPRYLSSSLAVLAQMFCLGSTLVGLPLYLTVALRESASTGGLLVFAMPAAMTVFAPLSGAMVNRWGGRPPIVGGLVLMAAGEIALARACAAGSANLVAICLVIAIIGLGFALIQTAAAAGATAATRGAHGAGLGLFNQLRFSGSAVGAAWAATALGGSPAYGVLFGVAAAAALSAAGVTWLVGSRADVAPRPGSHPSAECASEGAPAV